VSISRREKRLWQTKPLKGNNIREEGGGKKEPYRYMVTSPSKELTPEKSPGGPGKLRSPQASKDAGEQGAWAKMGGGQWAIGPFAKGGPVGSGRSLHRNETKTSAGGGGAAPPVSGFRPRGKGKIGGRREGAGQKDRLGPKNPQ